MSILLAGASHETLCLAQRLGVAVSAVSDPTIVEDSFHGLPCYQSDDDALAASLFDGVILAIDTPSIRSRAGAYFKKKKIPLIDLTEGLIDTGTAWGVGLLVQRDASVSVDCRLGVSVRLNIGALVMHDVTLGDYVTLAPRASLMGHVRVGSLSYIGAGAIVLPNVVIGEKCVIGAGAVVTRDVPIGHVVKGNPAK
jgi:sugar O-acyltransferase (sialic acid O-acetyltransferase NeuD family)